MSKRNGERLGDGDGSSMRLQWLERLNSIVRPVLSCLAAGELRARMPVEQAPWRGDDRALFSHLEAFGRSMAGLAPWLELSESALSGRELELHKELSALAREALARGVDPSSPDALNFEKGQQPLVDAAFLAHALVRAPKWAASLPAKTKRRSLAAFEATRSRKPCFNNWLLFAAMTETAIRLLGGRPDLTRVDYALRQHELWYKGGGVYGDGPDFHFDYYNSFVIQPMLMDVLRAMGDLDEAWRSLLPKVLERARRYAQALERLVAPDGSFPALGRSIAYRCGAFQHLAQLALEGELPASLPPGQVRSALNLVIARTLDAPGTFDADGWLKIGLCGSQPSLGEGYVSTGSLYLCSTAFLPLGLPPDDPFWTSAPLPVSWALAWSGADLQRDHD